MNRKNYLLFIGITILVFAQITYGQDTPHDVMNDQCNVCHSPQSWTDIRFDHNKTDFELVGKHVEVGCAQCHQLEDFSKIQSDCISCHSDVHQAKLGFLCNECHTPTGWSDLNIVTIHSNTNFPLTGAHLSLDCKACHISEVENEFTFLDTECYNCHQSEFINNPNSIHTALESGTDCRQCHTTSAWQPAGFREHDRFFPIFSGAHTGAWASCTDCHISPGNFQVFSCITCHEHNQQEMDDEHDEVPGYVYESNACLSCHPTGREE